jgi:site-specific DNA recombinase
MTCANDNCLLTGDVQKEKYVYYRCTGNRGECDLPRFKEEVLADRLGDTLKGLQVPPAIVSQIVDALRDSQGKADDKINAEPTRLESRLTLIHNRLEAAYNDKVDGKITEDFWQRKNTEWQMEAQQAKMALDGLVRAETGDRALRAEKVFELANRAYSLYVWQD